MVRKYSPRPVCVDVIKWTGTNIAAVDKFIGNAPPKNILRASYERAMRNAVIYMSGCSASPGDYIARFPDGTLRVYTEKELEMLFEPIGARDGDD